MVPALGASAGHNAAPADDERGDTSEWSAPRLPVGSLIPGRLRFADRWAASRRACRRTGLDKGHPLNRAYRRFSRVSSLSAPLRALLGDALAPARRGTRLVSPPSPRCRGRACRAAMEPSADLPMAVCASAEAARLPNAAAPPDPTIAPGCTGHSPAPGRVVLDLSATRCPLLAACESSRLERRRFLVIHGGSSTARCEPFACERCHVGSRLARSHGRNLLGAPEMSVVCGVGLWLGVADGGTCRLPGDAMVAASASPDHPCVVAVRCCLVAALATLRPLSVLGRPVLCAWRLATVAWRL